MANEEEEVRCGDCQPNRTGSAGQAGCAARRWVLGSCTETVPRGAVLAQALRSRAGTGSTTARSNDPMETLRMPHLHRRALIAATAFASTLALGLPALAKGKTDFKIALIASKTGPLEAYAKQTIVGFQMGLEYATGGTMAVAKSAQVAASGPTISCRDVPKSA